MFSSVLYTIYSAYISNKLTLEEFEGRLVPLLPAIFESSDLSANELAGAAELGLSEIDSGILDEDGFRHRLARALSKIPSWALDARISSSGATFVELASASSANDYWERAYPVPVAAISVE